MLRFLFLLPALLHAQSPDVILYERESLESKIELETPIPHITKAYFLHDEYRTPLSLSFNSDATEAKLSIPEELLLMAGPIAFEASDHSKTFQDGRVFFSALDAKVIGTGAKLETHPGNHRIGYWGKIEDQVVWKIEPFKPGTYTVDLTYSLSSKKSDIELAVGGKKLKATIHSTDSWYTYTTVELGSLSLTKEDLTTLTVRGLKKYGGAVMNLKAVTLRPHAKSSE